MSKKTDHKIFYAYDNDVTPVLEYEGGVDEGGMSVQIRDEDTCMIVMAGINAHIELDRGNLLRILGAMDSVMEGAK